MKLKAFTLIELLVVIAIIGILSGTLFVSIGQKPLQQARDAKRVQDLRGLQQAVERFMVDNGRPPQPALGWNAWSGHCDTYGNRDADYILELVPAYYLPFLPKDPRWDTGGQCYLYYSDGVDYAIITHFTAEAVCGGDPGDPCNPPHIRQLDRLCCVQPTFAVSSPGGSNW